MAFPSLIHGTKLGSGTSKLCANASASPHYHDSRHCATKLRTINRTYILDNFRIVMAVDLVISATMPVANAIVSSLLLKIFKRPVFAAQCHAKVVAHCSPMALPSLSALNLS